MIDLAFVERLIRALDESSLDNLELERGGTRVRLSKSPCGQFAGPAIHGSGLGALPAPALQVGGSAAPPASSPVPSATPTPEMEVAEAESGYLEVTSPMVGTFYAAPAPDAAPYVQVGQEIGKGTVLCIIEAMKLMNELESEVSGTIAKVMVENAQPVEYGQVLFLIDPS